jgi:hypothetical protein
MDSRLRDLAEKLDAHVIGRREFLRKAAVITGGTAAGLKALESMAGAQSGTKLRLWLFKSYVTAGNDLLAKQVEAWAASGRCSSRSTGRPSGIASRSSCAIEAGNPPTWPR